jgi:phage terminase large subunit-like protein
VTLPAFPESLADRFAAADAKARAAALWALGAERQAELAQAAHTGQRPWWFVGRSDQFEPSGDWRYWVINAGRGWGKTRTGGEQTLAKMRRYRGARVACIAPTYGDGRDTMIEGVSGMLSCLSPTELRGGSIENGWNRSNGELFFANGSKAQIFSSERPFRLRGPQHHFLWGDEPSYWLDVNSGTAKDSTFSNANIGLRLPPHSDWDDHYRPTGIFTMTPRLVPLLKVDDETLAEHPERAGLLQRDDVLITQGATMANLRNLDRAYYNAVIAPLLGTTLGLQELMGVLLEDVEGALWTRALISDNRAELPPEHELSGTVVALDPSGGEGINRDEHGIIVVSSRGYQNEREWYVRADRSINGSPTDASERCIMLAFEYEADAIVIEKNMGQDWLETTLKSTFDRMKLDGTLEAAGYGERRLPPIELVPAVKSKLQRATPVRGFYQQHRVHHVTRLATLEGQMTTWVPGESESPDRIDALVWAIMHLYANGPSRANVASPAQRERRGRRPNQPNTRMPVAIGTRSR